MTLFTLHNSERQAHNQSFCKNENWMAIQPSNFWCCCAQNTVAR